MKRNWQIIGIGLLFCLGIIVLYWVYLSHTIPKPFILGIEKTEFANSVSSLSALFSGLAIAGVLLTIYIQVTDSNKAAEALTKSSEALINSANESKEKSILDLYQTFCSSYFQEIKTSSHNVLISAVKNESYANYMVSRFFVIGKDVNEKDSYKNIRYELIENKLTNKKSFDESEQKDRFKLDELINFFTLLVNKKSSEDIIKSCDFFYDWWRPLFWFIAIKQIKYYDELKNEYKDDLNNYCKEPKFILVVLKLDKIYGYSNDGFLEEKNICFWKYFIKHPKIKSYNYDKKYNLYSKID